MLTVYAPDGRPVTPPPTSCPGCWIELIEPGQHDIDQAAALSGVDPQLIVEALDLHERPRIEQDDDATLLVIRAPHMEEGPGQERHSTAPLGMLITRRNIITVCRIRDEQLERLLHASRARSDGMRSARAICEISRQVAILFLHYLKGISGKIREVERELSQSLSNEELMTLLNLQKSVTYFHAALKTNDLILDRVSRKGLTVAGARLAFTEDEEDVLDDSLTETRQGIYMAKIFTEVLNSVAGVYSSVISNNVNQIMKLLTSFTVILMIPTLITSMYGMNIALPLQGHPGAFAVVGCVSAALAVGAVWYMKLRRML
jgi:magnesium transporter